jgi:redox-sensitive bicupin YhaK (pirin superfamily)
LAAGIDAGANRGEGMIQRLLDPKIHDLGGGFQVARLLPKAECRSVGPFVFFDRMGPADFPAGIPRTLDVRPHPHIGLATLTYLFSGEIMHRDSVGSVAAIRPGEVNWMIAGRGITHSERFEKARAQGDRLHGLQVWLALPQADEEMAPSFTHHEGDELPAWSAPGLAGRLVAGTAHGLSAGVPVRSPTLYVHLELAAGTSAELPDGHAERAVFVVSGAVEIDGAACGPGQMALLDPRAQRLHARVPSVVIVLGGEPLGERHLFWNFVSSSRERIEQAKADWREGRMKLPDADHDEFIPLPG